MIYERSAIDAVERVIHFMMMRGSMPMDAYEAYCDEMNIWEG